MEERKNEFFIFTIILLLIGFLQYFRKILTGTKMNKISKILYLVTLIIFSISTMFVLYVTDFNNVLSFMVGLIVATSSEQIAKLFLTIGSNFTSIGIKIVKNYSGIDLTDELKEKKIENKTENNFEN